LPRVPGDRDHRLLEAGGTLEKRAEGGARKPAHPKLYDRNGDEITLDEVERLTI